MDSLQFAIANLIKQLLPEYTHITSQSMVILVNLFTRYIHEFTELLKYNTNIGHRSMPDMLDIRATLNLYTTVNDLMTHVHSTLLFERRTFKTLKNKQFGKVIPLLPCKKPPLYPHIPLWPSEHTFQHTVLTQPFVHTPISVRIQGSKELVKQIGSLNKMNKKILANDRVEDTANSQDYWNLKAKTTTLLEIQ